MKDKVYLLPGMGVDERLLLPQTNALQNVVAVPWIRERRGEPLVSYARRLAVEHCIPRHAIVGGVSMGGMVAWEIAGVLESPSVVLIASANAASEITMVSRLAAAIGGPFASKAFPLIRSPWRTAGSRLMGMTRSQAQWLAEISSDTRPEFMEWAPEAIIRWKPKPLPGVNIHRIHGDRDWIIMPKSWDGVRRVRGAGHFLNVTHAEVVNEFLDSAT